MIQANDPLPNTSITLLAKLRATPYDESSWDRFVQRYGGLIMHWCGRWGVSRPDAEEITQNVMLQLARQIQKFEYDPGQSFRGWLRTVARRAWCDFIRDKYRRCQSELESEHVERLGSALVTNDFVAELEREADREELELIMDSVRIRVAPQTWQAFELTALRELPPQQVATDLGVNVATVYVAKSRIIRMIREDWQRLRS